MIFEFLVVVLLVVAFLAIIFLNKKDTRPPHPIFIKKFLTKSELELYNCLHEIVQDYDGVDLISKTRWEDIWNAKYGKTHFKI